MILEMKDLSTDQAFEILQTVVVQLSYIDPNHLTSFELHLLRKIAHVPKEYPNVGAEYKILGD